MRNKDKTIPKLKKKTCPICKKPFTPWTSLQKTCNNIPCAIQHGKQEKEKASRRENKKKKAELKPNRQLVKEAQIEFNKFIRERDYDQPCICCGRFANEEIYSRGGYWDCGHFLSVGSHPELRFEELNAHKQLKSCNAGSGKYRRKERTVSQEYEERLRVKIGNESVDWLQGPHEAKHYTRDELIEIKNVYRQKAKELKDKRQD